MEKKASIHRHIFVGMNIKFQGLKFGKFVIFNCARKLSLFSSSNTFL